MAQSLGECGLVMRRLGETRDALDTVKKRYGALRARHTSIRDVITEAISISSHLLMTLLASLGAG